MDDKAKVRFSKFLSFALRHKPAEVGITLDEAGWTGVPEVLAAADRKGHRMTLDDLVEVVRDNDKRRFALNEDRTRIRANQGHSVQVELGYSVTEPPEFLFHGTVDRFLDSIREKGLLKGERHHVHLSKDRDTALRVGSRRGAPVVLRVQALEMHRSGVQFFVSDNGVWLTDHVPSERIEFPC